MKKHIITTALLLTVAVAQAQNIYDATKTAQTELNGTARFVGMGGAMGALGGDISTISTNPAGIGIFRSSELSATLSYNALGVNAEYDGFATKSNQNRVTFDNFGFVLSNRIGNETPVRFVNLAFNYHKAKSFRRSLGMEGTMYGDQLGAMSQVRQMAEQANDGLFNNPDIIFTNTDVWNNPDAGWLAGLGAGGLLIQFPNEGSWYEPIIPSDPYALFTLDERGSVDVYDFNLSLNVQDRAYFGLSIGAYDMEYTRNTMYDETYDNTEGYSLESWNHTTGAGFDIKLGAIVRPFANSPFRIGAAIHSPTFYRLKYTTSARLVSDVFMDDKEGLQRTTIDTYDELGGDMQTDYRITTPWKFNGSLGYTIGSMVALGAEYEYQDYSALSFEDPNGYRMEAETNEAKSNLQGVHNVRLGIEVKPASEFALRAGYNYTTAAFKTEAIKLMPSNSIQTDTDWSNGKERQDFTLGLGYRGRHFYADLAYVYSVQKSDFYPFYNDFYTAAGDYEATVVPEPTKVTDTRNRVLLTLGIRF
ncbi:MAG: TonB-dependent receptor [Mediterranea sp.]|jgi:hypothetical protein|nr:TonB-dependent receptor [Mediterranea sp.]